MEKLQKWCDRNGGASQLAARLGISRQAVDNWFRRGHVPLAKARIIANITRVALKHLHPAFKDGVIPASRGVHKRGAM